MPLQYLLHPRSGLRDGVAHALAQLHLDRLELGSHPFLNRLAERSPLASRHARRHAGLRSSVGIGGLSTGISSPPSYLTSGRETVLSRSPQAVRTSVPTVPSLPAQQLVAILR